MRKLTSLFLSGLAVLLPVSISLYLIWWLFVSIDGLLAPLLLRLSCPYIPGLGFVITILLILTLGFINNNILGTKLISLGEKLLLKTPFLGRMYAAIKKIIYSFLVPSGKNAFQKVVILEFFSKDTFALGFITNENLPHLDSENYSVFVPTTPNPTSGYFIIAPKSKVKILDISVEKAMELIISAGLINDREALRSLAESE